MSDLISRQAAKLKVARVIWEDGDSCYDFHDKCVDCLDGVPPAQPEPSIPISWIKKQIDWLKSMDNEFSNITAMNISTMVKKWKKEQENNDGSDKQTGGN